MNNVAFAAMTRLVVELLDSVIKRYPQIVERRRFDCPRFQALADEVGYDFDPER